MPIISLSAWIAAIGFFSYAYVAAYPLGTLVTRFAIPSQNFEQNGKAALLTQPLRFTIQPTYNNLSVVALSLQYVDDAQKTRQKNPNPAMLDFTLFDNNGEQIFTSSRHAYEIEGESQFPFGFPEIADSANHQYSVEITQEGGDQTDQVVLHENTQNTVLLYAKQNQKTPQTFLQFLVNRIQFLFSSWQFLFAVGFSGCVIYLVEKTKKTQESGRWGIRTPDPSDVNGML